MNVSHGVSRILGRNSVKPRLQYAREVTNGKIEQQATAAVERVLSRTSLNANAVIEANVEILNRCMQKVPVKDMRGRPLGIWRFDATAALRALELIGTELGMYQKTHKLLHGQVDPLEGNYDELMARIRVLVGKMSRDTRLDLMRDTLDDLDAAALTELGLQRIPKLVREREPETVEVSAS